MMIQNLVQYKKNKNDNNKNTMSVVVANFSVAITSHPCGYIFPCRYCFPFGRPEGALKATLSLLERVGIDLS